MTDDLRPYPEYKDAGLKWVGRIPKHWNEKRAKYFLCEVDERSTTGEEPLMSVSHKTGVTLRKSNVTMFKAASNIGHKICRPGDLVINTLWAWMAALGVSRQTGLVSPAYGVYRQLESGEYQPDFLDYLLRTPPYATEYRCRSIGITASRLRLYPYDFLRIPIVRPPLNEQEVIVSYLRRHDAQVRKFIRNRRRLIEVLNEQKHAIVNHAVTQGLDPNAQLKPSGVDWLGDVPVNWDVKRIKNVFREVDRRSGTGEGTLLSLSRHKGLVPHSDLSDRPPSASDLSKYKVCLPGELIMNRMQAWSGMFATATREGLISPDYSLFAAVDDVHVQYFEFLFKTRRYVDQFAAKSKGIGSGFNRLYTPEFGAIPVAVPPKPVQEQLLCRIDVESRDLNALIDRANREIDLIREYRTRLTTDVVTGKLDVRHLAPPSGDMEVAEIKDIDVEETLDDELDGVEEGDMAEEALNADD